LIADGDGRTLPCPEGVEIEQHARMQQRRQRVARVERVERKRRGKRCRHLRDAQALLLEQQRRRGGAEMRQRHGQPAAIEQRDARELAARVGQELFAELPVNGAALPVALVERAGAVLVRRCHHRRLGRRVVRCHERVLHGWARVLHGRARCGARLS
jgi:hypothetical protein